MANTPSDKPTEPRPAPGGDKKRDNEKLPLPGEAGLLKGIKPK